MTSMRLSGFLIVLLVLLTSASRGQDRARAVPMFDVMEQSIEDLQRAMESGQVTSRELVEIYLARIEAYDQKGPTLNAIIALNPHAREAADRLDAERAASGPRGPMHGIPVLVKDNYETAEMPTTAGSIALRAFHPQRDAFLVRRLKDAGAVILGKTTMHELAFGYTTAGSSFGQTRNPYDLGRTPGGSSGGTGAAIAANFAAVGMGSDTCGSIRVPAASNNLVGLRGTQGLSSRAGIVPLSGSQDIGGPIARTIADLAIVLDATVAADTSDRQTMVVRAGDDDRPGPPSPPGQPAYRRALDAGALNGARLGVARSLFGGTPDDQEVTAVVNRALQSLRSAGAELDEVVIPGVEELLRDSSLVAAEFKFDLMEYLASADNPPVRSLQEILDRGLYHGAVENTFRNANAPATRETEATRRARIKQAALREVTSALVAERRLDAIVYPTLRRRPARIGDPQAGTGNCALSAHSGLPAVSVPAGFTTDGVPIGMELLGPAFSEADLLSLGYAIEQTLKLRRPPSSTPALTGGNAPPARRARASGLGATVELTLEPATARMRYAIAFDRQQAQPVFAIWLHSGTPEQPGAGRHVIYTARGAAAAAPSGTFTLSPGEYQDLHDGKLSLRFYPPSGESVTVHLPEMRAWK